ncbi:MAG TPA: DUF480 domain-containing protein [Lacipirellulaceae bacterium]|nr:DUF480 domain-containing protein [Lacipirellulaceae bacterium]
MSGETESSTQHSAPRWHALDATERRVLGVLIEKAKTTPENYPLSLNAIKAGANQKSNRSPLMQLQESQIEEALEKLRKVGAAAQVQGTGRVDRYRHLAYEWLGVEKVELAVMAELLLRGAQTVGELRGRAARMEPIKDLHELQPTLDSLAKKQLIQYLTPPGRGCVVTHTLYLERELEKVRREVGIAHAAGNVAEPEPIAHEINSPAAMHPVDGALSDQIHSLKEEVQSLKRDLAIVRAEFQSVADKLRHDLIDLNRQLGN